MNKKGVSSIVATVLLILLVLVMIFLIWFFIRNFIQSGSEQIPYSSQCLKIGVEPVKCIYANNCFFSEGNQQGNTSIVGLTVKRSGESGTLSGLAFLFENQAGGTRRIDNTQSIVSSALPREGEYALLGPFLNDSFIPANVNVAAILGAQRHVCEFTSPSITCFKELGKTGRCANQDGVAGLSINDYTAFQTNFALNKSYPYGDINADTLHDINDFIAFCVAYNAQDTSGCPV